MKLQFKHNEYQSDAVEAVVDCFAGQPKVEGVNYRLDPGKLPLELIEVQSGSYLGEDDIVRFEDVYGR